MRKTNKPEIDLSCRILVSTDELKGLLSCGRYTATKIGTEAGARVQMGRRILWNRDRVQKYLEEKV